MNVKNTRAIRTAALEALAVHQNPQRIPLVYAGFSALLSLAVTVISYVLSLKIDQMTGLANMGTRAVFSTVKTALPLAQLIFLLGWEMGYQMCALRLARRRYAESMDLKNGFSKFGTVLRTKLLMGVVYIGLGIATMYLSVFIFMSLPISDPFYEIVTPLLDSATILNNGIVIDEATLAAATAAVWPAIAIFGTLFLLGSLPVFYGFRMVPFCIADNSQRSGLIILKESRTMMKGHRLSLFKLDLSFWWFFLLEGLISVIAYLDLILPLLGITLPWSDTISYYGFYILSLAAQVALYWAYLNKVTIARAVFYDAVRPENPTQGVTLGNIFDLAKEQQE